MQQTEVDLRDILAILRRQRRLIVMTLALTIGLVLIYLLMVTPIYRATTLVQVEAGGANLLDPGASGAQQSAVLNSLVDSEVEILRSAATSLAVVERGQLVNDPQFGLQTGLLDRTGLSRWVRQSTDRLRRAVGLVPRPPVSAADLVTQTLIRVQEATQVRRRGQTYLIAISVASEDPAGAARLANLTAQTYIDRQVGAKTAGLIAARDVLRRQMETARLDLAGSEDALNGFIENNLARLETESGRADVATLRAQLESAKTLQDKELDRIEAVQAAAGQQDWVRVAARLEDTALAALARQRGALERQVKSAVAGAAEAVDTGRALAAIDRDLQVRAQAALAALRTEIGQMAQDQATTRNTLRDTLLQGDVSSGMLTDLFNLQQIAGAARKQYQVILARVQDIGTLANLQIADARIVSEALPPSKPSFPDTRLLLSVAAVVALGLGVGLAFLNEYHIGGVTSAGQLRNILQSNVPVTLASLSPDKTQKTFSDQVIRAPLSAYAEGFRRLRSAVDIALRDLHNTSGAWGAKDAPSGAAWTKDAPSGAGRGRVILVCSAVPDEGKSTTALSLARTYAAAGLETLLIDADLRKPSLHSYIGTASATGLLSFLRGTDSSPDGQFQSVRDPLCPLTVITAGERSQEPTDQLLSGKAFGQLLQAAQGGFDVVIFDSPPVLAVVDARYLAQHAEAVVMVVRYATTTQGEVREAAQQLRDMMRPGVQLIGVLSHERHAAEKSSYAAYPYTYTPAEQPAP